LVAVEPLFNCQELVTSIELLNLSLSAGQLLCPFLKKNYLQASANRLKECHPQYYFTAFDAFNY
jgi:hypothetical protein